MKKTVGLSLIISVLAFALMIPVTNAESVSKGKKPVEIKGASRENPVVHLGKKFDEKSGKMVDGYVIVHYASQGTSNEIKPSVATCYVYAITNGAKWKTVEPWIVDSAGNGSNITASFMLSNMTKDIAKWETAAGRKRPANILGNGSISTTAEIVGQFNGKNEVAFAPIVDGSAIALTYIWGNFGGDIYTNEIVEWDHVYNSSYRWATDGDQFSIDFENIATHELGHAVGLGDIYDSTCSSQTMYGYANYGETYKRDLAASDIAGVRALYR